jgi:pimeloyl-ACP methyl ester carboxylesterase
MSAGHLRKEEEVSDMNDDGDDKGAIVLVHGLWLTPRSWEHWVRRYTESGYRVVAPAWPRMDVEVEALREDPSVMNGLGLVEIADHYEKIIRALDRPPIIIGHSFGGALVQILLDRGLGRAGVAIDSAPVKGVLGLPLSSIRAAFPGLRNPATARSTVALTPQQWHYGFTNTMDAEQSRIAYDRYQVPSTGRPLWQAALANFVPKSALKVNLRNNRRAPLLFIAGGADHVAPASTNRENVKRYSRSTAVTDYKEFAGRPHFTCGAPGWEAVADYALAWASSHDVTYYPSKAG